MRCRKWNRLATGLYVPPLLGFAGPGWYPCCLVALCSMCSDATPLQLQVVIANMANLVCNDCADLDATYVLDWVAESGNICYWRYLFPENICKYKHIQAEIWTFGASVSWRVYLQDKNLFQNHYWLRQMDDQGDPITCQVTDLAIPYWQGASDCTAAGTCVITAL